MTAVNWVFKLSWLIPLLSLWLSMRGILRLTIGGALICMALLALWLRPTTYTEAPLSPVPNVVRAPQKSLPAMNSAQLYDLTRHFINPVISQQRDSVSLDFIAPWSEFTHFINQLAESSLAPQSYQIGWPDAANLQTPGADLLTVDLHLSPGTYRGDSIAALTLAPAAKLPATPNQVANHCPTPTLPTFTVQAAWPSRHYIQILYNGRSERLAINEMLENSWQLLRIGSESVEFRPHTVSPACPQPESVTVAI